MNRNEHTNIAVTKVENIADDTAENKDTSCSNNLVIPETGKADLLRAMKIGYYKEFYKQGLITADQLDFLLSLQNENSEADKKAA